MVGQNSINLLGNLVNFNHSDRHPSESWDPVFFVLDDEIKRGASFRCHDGTKDYQNKS